jgi:hypothetical protein
MPSPALTDDDTAYPQIEGLTAKQSAFVYAYALQADNNAAAAARAAGYAEANAATAGYLLLQRDDILQHIQRIARSQGAASLPKAVAVMSRLLDHSSGHVRHAAAADLMDRFGLKAPDKHHIAAAGGISITIDLGGGEGGKNPMPVTGIPPARDD